MNYSWAWWERVYAESALETDSSGQAKIRDRSTTARMHSYHFQGIILCLQVIEGYCATLLSARTNPEVL
jgi:hypothetical protein